MQLSSACFWTEISDFISPASIGTPVVRSESTCIRLASLLYALAGAAGLLFGGGAARAAERPVGRRFLKLKNAAQLGI